MESLVLGMRGVTLRPSRYTCQACRNLSTSAPRSSRKTPAPVKKEYRTPYERQQARAKKAANESRQEQLAAERQAALGDPVRGTTTPFLESFDTAQETTTAASGAQKAGSKHLNYFLDDATLQKSIDRSLIWSGRHFTPPLAAWSDGFGRDDTFSIGQSPKKPTTTEELLNPDPNTPHHKIANEALRRITNLDISSSNDRLRVNIKRCISTFGRHNTDEQLPSKPEPGPTALLEQAQAQPGNVDKTPRIGPDTGSSEVQIAILTARIRTLADFLGGRGRKDKMNKRNLRLLVHRRAKLLKYLRRKERGGPRFQNVVETLGLTPGTWEGEITLP